MSAPKVSVLMPTRNHARFLPEAIESLLEQDFLDYELLVVDNCSEDESVEVIRKYAALDRRIRFEIQPVNVGMVANWNHCLAQAKGEYVLLLFSDDKFGERQALGKMGRMLDENPSASIAVAARATIDENSQFLLGRNLLGADGLIAGRELIQRCFLAGDNLIGEPATVLFRKAAGQRGFNLDYRHFVDLEMWFHLLEQGDAVYTSELLCRFRVHPGQQTTINQQEHRGEREYLRLLADYLDRPYLDYVNLRSQIFTRLHFLKTQGLADDFSKELEASLLTSPGENRLVEAPARTGGGPAPTRLNILHTVEFYAPHVGGSETVVQQMSERLARRGHQVTVATSQLPEGMLRELNGVIISGFAVNGRMVDGITGEFQRYRQFLRDHPAEVMMNYAAQQWATDLAFEVLRETRARRVNIIAPCGYSALTGAHAFRWPRFHDYFTRVLPEVLPQYDAVVYHSAYYQDFEVGRSLGLDNGVVIPNAADADEFLRDTGIDFREKFGVTTRYLGICVANFMPGKGQERVIECVRQMNRPDFTCVLIGKDGAPLAELRRQAAGLPVQFLVGISREETVAAFRAADLFLFGSHIEAAPLVIIEAKAARLPFVSTDCGNVREWRGGVVCAADQLATEANRLLDDECRRRQLGEEGWREWKDKLTWDAVVDRWEELYLRLHRQKTGPRAMVGPAAEGAPTCPKGGGVVVIFSQNAPLQLDATLYSLRRHMQEAEGVKLVVLYTACTPQMEALYRQVQSEHPGMDLVRASDFRRQLPALVQAREQAMFLGDGCLIGRDFSFAAATKALNQHRDAIGFSLRLGGNANRSRPVSGNQRLPEFDAPAPGLLKWRWPAAEQDYCRPLETSGSLYRVADLWVLLNELDYCDSESLEAALAAQAADWQEEKPFLLCFPILPAFCVPFNPAQPSLVSQPGTGPRLTSKAMAELFAAGQRFDVSLLDDFPLRASAEELELKCHPAGPVVKLSPMVPEVSVVIPCYNQAQFLAEAVTSVVAQTFGDWEVIIVNDGSPDNTSEVARGLIERYPQAHLRLVEQPNAGLSAARNAGLQVARGKYLLPLDADDRIAPDFLRKAVAVLETNLDIGFVYSHIEHFGLETGVYRLPEFDAATMVHKDNVGSVCSLMRREIWEQVGGYNVNMKGGYEDWDFWVGCIEKGWPGYRIPEPLFHYRKKEGSMLTQAAQMRERLIARLVLNHPGLYSPERLNQARLVSAGAQAAAQPRRILLACTHFWPSIGGLETEVEILGSRLVKRGYQVDVAALAHPGRFCSQYRGLQIINLEPGRKAGRKQPRAAEQLRELVASSQYDACVLFADPLNWIFGALEGRELKGRTRVIAQPLINVDGYERWKGNRDFRARLSRWFKRLHAVVAISTNGQEVKFLREEGIPFVYVPNAAELPGSSPDFRKRCNLQEDETLLLQVANLWPVKNHLGLLAVMPSLPGKWRLVMIGHATEDQAYAREVREASMADRRFLLIPGLSREEVGAAMAAADVILLPSLGEVSPVTILEAMSHKKPWVATPECGAVHDNAGGIVVALDRFPEVLQTLMAKPELAKTLGQLGWEHWQACFGGERFAAAWEDVILTGQTRVSFDPPPEVQEAMAKLRTELEFNRLATGPKVSVIVPTKDRPHLLPEALGSILNQTLQDFEIIVVNDGGLSVADLLAPLNGRGNIVGLAHPTTRGPAAARNTGLRAARGRYVAYLDDDDVFLPEHLATLAGFLESTGKSVAYTDAYCAKMKLKAGAFVTSQRTVAFGEDWDADRILAENFVPTLCFMHELACIRRVGGFDESLATQEDWDMWIRLSQSYEVAHIKQVTCEFREREGAGSITSHNRADFERTARIIFEKYRHFAEGKPKVLAQQRERLQESPTPPFATSLTGPTAGGQRRKKFGGKLRRSIRKRLATVSQWLED